MLMFTHSWLLANYLGEKRYDPALQALYAYNICPDFLPASPAFDSRMTHGVPRFRPIPDDYGEASFILFHLMADDIAHYGVIKEEPVGNFQPDAAGYAYRKGKSLRGRLMDLYRGHGEPIDLAAAAYRSHMVIEMAFDLALYRHLPEREKLLAYMCEALRNVATDHGNRFIDTVSWFYGVPPRAVSDALMRSSHWYNDKIMNRFMTLEGRVQGFFRKYGPQAPTAKEKAILTAIMEEGMLLVKDGEDFLVPTLTAINNSGFAPSLCP